MTIRMQVLGKIVALTFNTKRATRGFMYNERLAFNLISEWTSDHKSFIETIHIGPFVYFAVITL